MLSKSVLPTYLVYFLKIIPYFLNISANSYSGREVKRILSLKTNFLYVISNAQISKSQFLDFYEFFVSRLGSFKTFYVKNFLDYKVINSKITIPQNQKIFLYKTYRAEEEVFERSITFPIVDTIDLRYDDKKIKFTFDEEECCMQINEYLPLDAKLNLSFEFLSEVRFAEDTLNYKFLSNNCVELSNIKLVQVYN